MTAKIYLYHFHVINVIDTTAQPSPLNLSNFCGQPSRFPRSPVLPFIYNTDKGMYLYLPCIVLGNETNVTAAIMYPVICLTRLQKEDIHWSHSNNFSNVVLISMQNGFKYSIFYIYLLLFFDSFVQLDEF